MIALDVAVQTTALSVLDAVTYEEWASALDVGVPVRIALWQPKETELGFLTGIQLFWREDEDGYGVSRWEVPIEFAWRRHLPGERWRGFGELAVGPHVVLALADYVSPMPDVAIGLTLGTGAEIGTGPVRGVLGARGRLVVSPWVYSAYVLTADGYRSGAWSSSDLRLEVYAGASFR